MSERAPQFAAPLTIGVIADTHIYRGGRRRLPPEIAAFFRRAGVGLILHCGDINVAPVLTELEAVAPVVAVAGNNDEAELQDRLSQDLWFTVGRFSFVLVHGHQGKTARAVARGYAGRCDCVVYGHSHIPKMEEVNGTVLFNPGSATERRWSPHFGVGLIVVTPTTCRPDLVLFNDPAHLASLKVARDGAAEG